MPSSRTDRTPGRRGTAVRFEVDHLEYQLDRGYRRQVLIGLRRLRRRGRFANLDDLHKGDCCEREAWSATLASLVLALVSDGEYVAYANEDGVLLAGPRGGR